MKLLDRCVHTVFSQKLADNMNRACTTTELHERLVTHIKHAIQAPVNGIHALTAPLQRRGGSPSATLRHNTLEVTN
jgi:hypothetical protein